MSIINTRLLYLREFCEGLKLFNVYGLAKENAALCKDLLVQNASGPVDSDYVFSVLSPCYSDEGTSRRKVEEEVMDNFQDFLATVEDNNITGYTVLPLPFRIDMSRNILWSDLLQRLDYRITDKYRS